MDLTLSMLSQNLKSQSSTVEEVFRMYDMCSRYLAVSDYELSNKEQAGTYDGEDAAAAMIWVTQQMKKVTQLNASRMAELHEVGLRVNEVDSIEIAKAGVESDLTLMKKQAEETAAGLQAEIARLTEAKAKVEVTGESRIKALTASERGLREELSKLQAVQATKEEEQQREEAALWASSAFLEEKVGSLHQSLSSKRTAAEADINELSKQLRAPLVSSEEVVARERAMTQEESMKAMVFEMRQVPSLSPCPSLPFRRLTSSYRFLCVAKRTPTQTNRPATTFGPGCVHTEIPAL